MIRLCTTLIWIDPERETKTETREANRQRMILTRQHEQRQRARPTLTSVKKYARQFSAGWSVELNRQKQGSSTSDLIDDTKQYRLSYTSNESAMTTDTGFEESFGPAIETPSGSPTGSQKLNSISSNL